MKLIKHLSHLGYGSRKEVQRMIKVGLVTTVDGAVLGERDLPPHEMILLGGEELDPVAPLTIILNKPIGFTCSTEDPGETVYDLLPYRFALRKPILSTVGRLDKETSGMLLMTDDGKLLHKLIHPKSKVSKVYEVVLDRPLKGDEADVFGSGELMLKDERSPLKPAGFEKLNEKRARVSLDEGRYHQVRRMFAAVGNHVLELKRISMGGLCLPDDISEGEWRGITDDELSKVLGR